LAFAVPFSVVYFGLRTSFCNLAVLCPSASFKFCIDLCLFYLSTKSIRPCLNNKIYHGGFDFAFATYIRHFFVAPVLGQHDRSVPITSRSAQIQAIFSKSEARRPAAVEPNVPGSQAYPRHSILRRRLSSRGSTEPFLCCLQLMLCLSWFRRRLSSFHRPHLFRCSDVTFSMLVKTAFLMAYAHLLGSTVAFLDVLVLIRECFMAICSFGSISLHSFRRRTCSSVQMMVTMRSSVNLVIDASGARVLSGWPLVAPFAQRMHCHCFQV
jgi:hypothetical protein